MNRDLLAVSACVVEEPDGDAVRAGAELCLTVRVVELDRPSLTAGSEAGIRFEIAAPDPPSLCTFTMKATALLAIGVPVLGELPASQRGSFAGGSDRSTEEFEADLTALEAIKAVLSATSSADGVRLKGKIVNQGKSAVVQEWSWCGGGSVEETLPIIRVTNASQAFAIQGVQTMIVDCHRMRMPPLRHLGEGRVRCPAAGVRQKRVDRSRQEPATYRAGFCTNPRPAHAGGLAELELIQ